MPKMKKNANALFTLLAYLKKYRIRLIIGVLLALFGVLFTIFGPYIVKMIIEAITIAVEEAEVSSLPVAIDFGRVTYLGIVGVITYLLAFLGNYGCAIMMSGVTADASKSLRSDMSKKMNRLPLSYFDSRQIGDVLSIITNDVDTIGQTLNQSLTTLMSSVLTLLGVAIMMLILDWRLALIAIAFVPISLFVLLRIVKKSQTHFVKQQLDLGEMNGHAEEVYSAVNVIRVYKGDIHAKAKFDSINDNLKNDGYKSLFYSGLSFPITTMMGNLSFAIICIVGGIIAVRDITMIGTIVACVTYSKQFTMPLSQIATISTNLQTASAASSRVFTFLSEQEQSDESHSTLEIEHVDGNVSFFHVKFGYNQDKIIIHDFNLETKAGQKVAIVGPTGAGKTTMVNLLMRFYDTNDGYIAIEGKKTKEVKRANVRKNFAMVLQDTWLFEGTILENLKFGRQDATLEEIKEACKLTHCDTFIEQLPNQYNFHLSEDSALSAGQKQLLTIARAMIQAAPMLILDEATSSVDTRTELLIQEAMDNLTHGHTSFVIAHRLSTIKNSDLIIVMKDGDVIETGNHDELMKKKGFYADLYNSQFASKGENG